MIELPKSWVQIPLGDDTISKKGKKPKTLEAASSSGLVPYLDIKAFEKGIFEKYATLESGVESTINDSLMVWDGARSGLVGNGVAGVIGSTLMRIRPKASNNRYLHYFLRSKFSEINSKTKGTGIPHVDPAILWNFEFPIAPLNEQIRIADKLDSMLAKVDAAQTRLDKIPNILKRFRQSVLAAATSGELTKEWRDKNQAKYSFKEYVFDDLLVELKNGLSPKPNQEGKGTAILRISSVRSGFVEQSDIRHLECDKKTEDKYKLQIGDLLFTRYNGSIDFVGVCGLIRELKHNELVYPDKLIRARLNTIAIPEYIEIYFSSDQARRNMTDCIKSTSGQKGISGKDIKAQKVIVPSTLEQKEIVSRVENLFAIVEKIEKQYLDAKAKINRLTQSILAKAFRGKLVAQNLNDEPAELLLRKIKQNNKTKKKK